MKEEYKKNLHQSMSIDSIFVWLRLEHIVVEKINFSIVSMMKRLEHDNEISSNTSSVYPPKHFLTTY